jgi:hypothetical protein
MAPTSRAVRFRPGPGTAVCLFAAFAVCAVAGCGGKPDSRTAGVGNEFAFKAFAVCATALNEKKAWQPFPVVGFDPAHPDRSKLPRVSAWLTSEVAPTFHTWLSSMQALGTPPSAEKEWTTLVAAIKRIEQLNSDQITAGSTLDPAAFATATVELRSIADDLVEASEKAGLADDCAEPFT